MIIIAYQLLVCRRTLLSAGLNITTCIQRGRGFKKTIFCFKVDIGRAVAQSDEATVCRVHLRRIKQQLVNELASASHCIGQVLVRNASKSRVRGTSEKTLIDIVLYPFSCMKRSTVFVSYRNADVNTYNGTRAPIRNSRMWPSYPAVPYNASVELCLYTPSQVIELGIELWPILTQMR